MSSWKQPEPLDWRPSPSFRERVLRGVSTPIAVGVVLFMAAVVVAVLIVALRPHAPEASGENREAAVEASSPSADLGQDAAAGRVLVHVIGEVRAPGLVELDADARVLDAIEAAGGATEQAALEGVNLARPVADGEQVLVPNAEELAASTIPDATAPGASSNGLVDLNRADAAELQTLPGIGPALAQRIIAWREANGSFTDVEQLLEVSGIGSRVFAGLVDLVRI